MPQNNSSDIFQDPDFLALNDAEKTDVLNQIHARTGVMPTPKIGAEENPDLGKLPGTNQPVADTARDAARIATTTVAGEGIGPALRGLRSRTPPASIAGTEEPIPGAPRQGPIDYARNARINRANIQTPTPSEYTGPATGGRPTVGRATGVSQFESTPSRPSATVGQAPARTFPEPNYGSPNTTFESVPGSDLERLAQQGQEGAAQELMRRGQRGLYIPKPTIGSR